MIELAVLLLCSELAMNFHGQGAMSASQGRYTDAVAFYEKAAATWRGLGPEYHPHLAIGLANLAQAKQRAGDFAGAVSTYHDALAYGGNDEKRRAAILSRLGGALAETGRIAEAEPLLRNALAVQKDEDPETGNTLNNLALLCVQTGKWKEAEGLVERALVFYNRAEPDSPDGATLLGNLASLHMQNGSPERAAPLLRRARRILERRYHGDNAQLAMILAQEGILLLNDNKTQLATQQLSEALRMLKATTGDSSLETSIAETNLAMAHLKNGKRKEACGLLEHALVVQEPLYNTETRALRITRQNLRSCRAV